MDAVAVLPPPVPAAMNRCGSSSCRSAIHFRPPARVARWILWAGRSYPSNRARAGGAGGWVQVAWYGPNAAARSPPRWRRMTSSMCFCRAASGFQAGG